MYALDLNVSLLFYFIYLAHLILILRLSDEKIEDTHYRNIII
jgi:hypothetical protein